MKFTMPHPIENEIPQLGFPYKFSETSPSARLRPPMLGEHAAAILGDRIAMDRQAIDQLIAEKVIFTAPQ
jgi:crotonobetainyl-CoA:carnitine CoA-transferase CaiB-like acyl-CoA transferase